MFLILSSFSISSFDGWFAKGDLQRPVVCPDRLIQAPLNPEPPGVSSSRYVIVQYEVSHPGRPCHAMVPRGGVGTSVQLRRRKSSAIGGPTGRQASPRGREVAAIQLKTMIDGNVLAVPNSTSTAPRNHQA